MWLEVVVLVLVYAMNIRTFESGSCPASKDTVHRVPSCPRNKEEWKQRSDAKNCSTILQNCTESSKFVYHCVINSFVNETLEVCAPEKQLIGHSCVEYNERGGLIQESPYVQCNDPSSACQCPFSYISTDVYQYQHCFQAIGSSKSNLARHSHGYLTMDSNRSSCIESCCDTCNNGERDWQIVAAVMIIINVALFVTTLLMVISKLKRRRTCNKAYGERQSSEGEPLVSNKKGKTMSGSSNGGKGGKETEKKRGKDKFYVAAIDIGLRYYNMALCCSESPEDVKPLGKWDRICLLITKKDIIFDKDAIKGYNGRKKGNRLIQDFELLSQVPKKEDQDVYTKIVKQLLKQMENKLRSELQHDMKDIDLHFVFIVPMYWSDDSITKLEDKGQAEVKEILNVDHQKFRVIRREKTISPFMHEVKARVLCLNFNVDNLVLDKTALCADYANLHIASSYFNLTFWRRDQKLPGKDENTKLVWKVPPHEYMLETIRNIYALPKKDLEDWKKNDERGYMSYLSAFEELENDMNAHTEEKHFWKARIPVSLHKIAQQNGATPDSIADNTKKVQGITTADNSYTFEVGSNFYKDCFSKIKETILEKIESEEKAFKNVKCVVMTGAYSQREMLRQEAETKWFKGKQITVVIPQDTQVFAMGGAYHIYKDVRCAMNNPRHVSEEQHNDCVA